MWPIQFQKPEFLWLIPVVGLPLLFLSWRLLRDVEPVRRTTIAVARCIVLAILVILLADPVSLDRHDRLTVIGLIDTSGSVRAFPDLPRDEERRIRDNLEYLRDWYLRAISERPDDDRVGLVIFDGRPIALATPTSGEVTATGIDRSVMEGTNIADAIRYGLAMFPPDTARRLVLVTDGNETAGEVEAAIREAVSGGGVESGAVPIDLVPIIYEVNREAMIERVEVPPYGRPDELVTVRVLMRSTAQITGRLTLQMEDDWVDLNGPEIEGNSRIIQLEPGLNVETATVRLSDDAVHRFKASFTPTNESEDTLRDNNLAEAFIVTPQRASVLIADGVYGGRGTYLPEVLEESGLFARTVESFGLPESIIELQAYDLVILQNVPAEDLTETQKEMLVQYVERLGGGLIMVGGYDSFGAGGWEDTSLARLLPVSLEVPEELEIPTAAIAIVLDRSGSMNASVFGTRRSQQEIANEGAALAIESLDPNDYLAVYSFASTTTEVVPFAKIEEPRIVAERVRTIQANGGTNMKPALERAFQTLRDADAEIKHVICLSDGRSQGSAFGELAARMQSNGISVSAIAVGDGADSDTLSEIARRGGGQFYFVSNPRLLPRIFVKDIRVVRRPLIREGQFIPDVLPTGSPIIENLETPTPPLGGLVLTQPLENDPSAILMMAGPRGEPILATKQAGLGRTGAFTSDAHDNWSDEWLQWSGYATMWTQLARSVGRPPGTREFELHTSIENDELRLSLLDTRGMSDGNDASSDDERGPSPFLPLSIKGFVYAPDGSSEAITLRQSAPATYTASYPAPLSGNYVVALTPKDGQQSLGLVIGGVSRPAGIEYRRLQSHTDTLAQLLTERGGRVLDPLSPESADLFNRDGLPESVSLLPWWPVLLWWALGAFLVDVALRRIAWDRSTITGWLARPGLLQQHAQTQTERAATTLRRLRERPAGAPSAGSPRDVERGASGRPGGRAAAARTGEKAPVTFTDEREKSEDEFRKTEPSEAERQAALAEARRRALAAFRGSTADSSDAKDAAPEPDKDAEGAAESVASRLLAGRRGKKNADDASSQDE